MIKNAEFLSNVTEIRGQIMLAINGCRTEKFSSRELSLVITKLEEADMWLTKAFQKAMEN